MWCRPENWHSITSHILLPGAGHKASQIHHGRGLYLGVNPRGDGLLGAILGEQLSCIP